MRLLLRSCSLLAVIAVLGSTVGGQTPAGPPTAASDAAKSRFPTGPGRDALFKVCSDCHGPESVLGHLKTHDEWKQTLDDMAANGAQGSDEEWNAIQAYLDQHYSLIAVNKAPATDLALTLDVPASVAQAIVQRRTEAGGIRSIEDLKQIPGIDAAKIDARKDRLIF